MPLPRRLLLLAVLSAAPLTAAEPAPTASKVQAPAQPIVPADIVLIGDSTVASKSGWGDAFAKLLRPGITCLNAARGGRSSKSYRDEGHWHTALAAKPKWVLIQFGHNDMPGKGPARETDARTTFRDNLVRFIADTRQAGAQPVLITSLTRRNFNAEGKIDPNNLHTAADSRGNTMVDLLNDYVLAARAVAAEQGIPLLDLNARSIAQLNTLGPAAAASFNPTAKPTDATHLSELGATETAKLVADEVRSAAPALAKLLSSS